MTSKLLQKTFLSAGVVLALGFAAAPFSARANVYATNIKLNGSLTNVAAASGQPVTISYILNEPASQGVTVEILSGATVVRSLSLAAGAAGSTRGLNTVSWDGKNGSGAAVPLGTYAVRINARSSGYTDWTQITSDAAPGSHSANPKGIAVNCNTNSPYYGRVFVPNSALGTTDPVNNLGDKVGIQKLNADGSYADEGGFSTGGWSWAGDFYSPWLARCKEDDRLYINDWTGSGVIIAFDQLVSSNQVVLGTANYSGNPFTTVNWSGFDITGVGTTNARVWLGDSYWNNGGDAGIWFWHMTNGVADPTDTIGTQVVAAGGDLSLYTYSIALDKDLNIYTS